MAPETLAAMLRGEDVSDTIDARANVYSCGALLYFLATGSLPFRSTSLEDLAHAQHEGKLWAPQAHNPEITAALQTVILSALAVDPARRYANTGELASVLAAAAWRDGYAESYEPSVVEPLRLFAQRNRRNSSVEPIEPVLREPADEARRLAQQRLRAKAPHLRRA
jgi:serine/threonine protein kinase